MASPRAYPDRASVVEPNYFSNWGDLWYPRLANRLLTTACRIEALTPTMVTLGSFALYLMAASLVAFGGSFGVLAAVALPVSYTLDCLDGQLARYTGRASALGDYLDKTLDVLKIGVINLAMAVAAYHLTGQAYYFLLGLGSCFGFLFRYYIKLETIFGATQRDAAYLAKSQARRRALYVTLDHERAAPKTTGGRVRWWWFRNQAIFALDEAEHVTFGALAVLVQRPDLWCWLFGVGQLAIALYRLVERGRQLVNRPDSLTDPLRK